MPARKKRDSIITIRQVVGTVHSPGSLKHALRLKPGAVDAIEARADHFAGHLDALRQALPRVAFPILLTVRHPQEGGAAPLGFAAREKIYRELLPWAAYIDVELRSAVRFAGLIEEAKARGCVVIVSDHHFARTPSEAVLKQRLQAASQAGADLVKVAARTEEPADLLRLTSLFQAAKGRPLSVMGMGSLGKMSRLFFARIGSALNYGYLDRPQVSGQWPAELLKQRLAELMSEA